MSSLKPIVLVACCGAKLAHAAPAGDIYTSDLFLKAKAYAEKFGAEWFILSAKFGLLSPTTVIEPYDETLNTKTPEELDDWNTMVGMQWGRLPEEGAVVVLAGAKYRGWLEGIEHTAPMARMGIGEQKAWLKAQVGERSMSIAAEKRAQRNHEARRDWPGCETDDGSAS